jgi:2,4-dienoyl-CoA reductase-like NADH-dependent reductase (Old Yellow Enzyme family)
MSDDMSWLFEPIAIRGVDIPNRIVMPSMTTRLATAEGAVTPELIRYYLARAEGGTGLITVEMCSPEPAGRHRKHELGILHDRFLPGLQQLTARLKAAGARTAIQIGHAGGHTREDVTGAPPVAPSALPHEVQEVDVRTVVPLELTLEGPSRVRGAPRWRLPPARQDAGGDARGDPARVPAVSAPRRRGASVYWPTDLARARSRIARRLS